MRFHRRPAGTCCRRCHLHLRKSEQDVEPGLRMATLCCWPRRFNHHQGNAESRWSHTMQSRVAVMDIVGEVG